MQLRDEVRRAIHVALCKHLGASVRAAIQEELVEKFVARRPWETNDGQRGETRLGGRPDVAEADVRQLVDEELKAIDASLKARLHEGGQQP